MRFFQKVRQNDDLDACVRVLEPEDVRAEFDQAFRRFAQSMDMLLPDPRALPFRADLGWLGKIRGAARARYHDGRLDLAGCGEKVRQLIEGAVIADGVQVLVREVPLFSPEFEKKMAALKTDEARASEMEHAIRHEIHVRLEENPAFYRSLRERLEQILEDRRRQRLDAAEQLTLLKALVDDVRGEQKTAQEIGLSPTGFAIYGLLESARPSQVAEAKAPYDGANRDLAGLIEESVAPLTDLVDWWQKEDVQREMRKRVKRQLRAAGLAEDLVDGLAADVVDLAKVRRRP
jgi:type I restriction enzyme R subunit